VIAVPIKLLGIIPTAAYNLAIPTIFSMLGLAGYSLAYNLVAHAADRRVEGRRLNPRLAGVAAALALVAGDRRSDATRSQRLGTRREGSGRCWSACGMRCRGRPLPDAAGRCRTRWTSGGGTSGRSAENGEPAITGSVLLFLYADLHAHAISRC
jgi:hypothetical protein